MLERGGTSGVTQDLKGAVQWYRRAAEQGHQAAQTNLGSKYRTGCGVGQDYGEAARWYRRAGNQGNRAAQ